MIFKTALNVAFTCVCTIKIQKAYGTVKRTTQNIAAN